VAMKRGRDPAVRPGNNPEMGCRRDEHYRSLISNGSSSSITTATGCLP
jgi:hypothetical protein